MALTQAELKKRATMMRAASSVAGPPSPRVESQVRTADPSVALRATPPSKAPSIGALGAGLTSLGTTAATAGAAAAGAGPLGAIAGLLVGLIGGAITGGQVERQRMQEGRQAQQIALQNRRALGEAQLQATRSERAAQRADVAQQMATPQQEMMAAPMQDAAPGAASRLTSALLRG